MERKFHTTDWSSRVNTTIFAMILVDCWKVYSQLTFVVGVDGKLVKQETQKEFFGNLAAEMIDNTEDIVATRRGANATPPGEQAIDLTDARDWPASFSNKTSTSSWWRDCPNAIVSRTLCCVCKGKEEGENNRVLQCLSCC
jgi:hypothetical protein